MESLCRFLCLVSRPVRGFLPFRQSHTILVRQLPLLFLGATGLAAAVPAQVLNRIPEHADLTQKRAIANHHPLWANQQNSVGLASSEMSLTLVLARSPEQQAAFEQLLADQQNLASPDYHHWLSAAEIGERFGISDADLEAVKTWIQSQGLRVNWISPSRTFIGFLGPAADVGRAFQTEVQAYKVNGADRISVSSDPMVPAALAPVIKAIHGLYTIDERPLHLARRMASDSPEMNSSSGSHYIAPADFAVIYDLPPGAGLRQTIGIVGRSRVNRDDIANFANKTGARFQTPIEIVPTAFGGVDPGPALTSPPAPGISVEDQLEATLDVTRAGSIAADAQLLLVVATNASGGIAADAQYLVQTSPPPAQIMNISFGACESAAGSAGVNFWDALFQQAAAEGISVFVSSGDAGASGCDANFGAPPANPLPNSPNFICSSSYATCVGGTEFNDTTNPSLYWSLNNNTGFLSARSYIPEGGWNEPLNGSATIAAASGGGVSSIISTPAWQTGAGVPATRLGRFTPDISFSSSCHDGYFACFAAGGAGCVTNSNGSFSFFAFCGTSAAAPSMAGIAALLDERLGAPQGNLNPEMYQMASTLPAAFHDTTVATSGVSGCDIHTPSMCNNSIPSPTGLAGGQAGYLLANGYDEVTGLGSLEAAIFLANFMGPKTTPNILIGGPYTVTTAQGLMLSLAVDGGRTVAPTGNVTFTRGVYTSAPIPLNNGTLTLIIPAGALAPGTDLLVASYTPDAAGAQIYNPATASTSITVTTVPMITPTVTLTPSLSNFTSARPLQVLISVNGGQSNQAPSGTVTLTSASYSSAAATLSSGNAYVTIPANTLAPGTDTLTANYAPDGASSTIYYSASGSVTITVPPSPTFTIAGTAATVAAGSTSGNTSTITVTPAGGFTGSVTLTATITTSPSGAQRLPSLSFGTTSPVNVTGTANGTAMLTITTTAPTTALADPLHRGIPWSAAGEATLACILLFGIPRLRRSWRVSFGSLLLLISLGSGVLACGGGSGSNKPASTAVPGTTPGNYVITVTGASGTTTASTLVNLVVQ